MKDLKPAKKIPVKNWMTAPETKAVLSALDNRALFVGGCVRNTLLNLETGDIDIATPWLPEQVIEKLEVAGIKGIPTGIDHGTVTAVINKTHFEITTLRKDVETDGRRAVVAFSENWLEDARRRDFTMNTLLADAEGNIFDPTGEGLKDLEAAKVRFVGDPETRIAEDYLRILRFFRFHAMVGKGQPDTAGLKACRYAAGKIPSLSKERITQEFFKILSMDNPGEILSIMFDNSVLKELHHPEYDPDFFRNACTFQNRYGLAFVASRLLLVAGLSLENLKAMEQLLLLPKVFKRDIEAISKILNLPDLSSDHSVRVAIYKYGRVPTAQALMIELAQDRVMNGYAPKAVDIIQKWDIPDLPLSGNDLMNAGIKEGPELGRKLAEIEEWWIAGGFKASKAECLKAI